jgi:hypothetical protein
MIDAISLDFVLCVCERKEDSPSSVDGQTKLGIGHGQRTD